MTIRILPLERPGHDALRALLPWYFMGTLPPEEHERVRAHLNDCESCRQELDRERAIAAAAASPLATSPGDVDRGWARLQQRLALEGAPAPTLAAPPPRARLRERLASGWRSSAAWLRGLALIEAGALVAGLVLAFASSVAPTPAPYRVLGDAPPVAQARLIVRFQPGATEAALRQALVACGCQLAAGPTSTDAYVVSVAPDQAPRALGLLRANPAVTLVEMLDRGGHP